MFRKNQKLLFLSAFSMVLSSASFANVAPPPIDPNFTLAIPNLKPGFSVNFSFLGLKAGASNLNYVIYNKALPAQSPTWQEMELIPPYAPAFALGIQYIFVNMGNDIQLNWTHLNSNKSNSITAPNSSYFLGPDFEIGPDAIPIRNASGKVNFQYDVINLDAGQFLNFGQYVAMRFFGGLSTAMLKEGVTATYSGNTTTPPFIGPFSMSQEVNSNFTGVGPRVGMHADVSTNTGFGFLGEAAISALIGSLETKTNYTGSGAELLAVYGQTTNFQTIKDQRVTQVIPGLDAKLGITYKYLLNPGMLLTLTAGYQAAVYINAISQYIPATLVTGQSLESGGIFVATMSHTLSNYSVQGPFLNFSLKFS